MSGEMEKKEELLLLMKETRDTPSVLEKMLREKNELLRKISVWKPTKFSH